MLLGLILYKDLYKKFQNKSGYTVWCLCCGLLYCLLQMHSLINKSNHNSISGSFRGASYTFNIWKQYEENFHKFRKIPESFLAFPLMKDTDFTKYLWGFLPNSCKVFISFSALSINKKNKKRVPRDNGVKIQLSLFWKRSNSNTEINSSLDWY